MVIAVRIHSRMNAKVRNLLASTLLLTISTGIAHAQSIDYVLRFPDSAQHLIDVEATIPAGDADRLTLFMPIWTPGSYLMREYARHVQQIAAFAGDRELPIVKSATNRWIVDSGDAQQITLRYRVYARELTVRTNYVDSTMAIINGAPTFITRLDARNITHTVRLELPREWPSSASGMPRTAGATYIAADFDTLVDSPIVAGTLDVREYTVAGKPHYLVSFGDLRFFDLERAARDAETITREQYRFWRELPYEDFWIFNAVVDGSGGLEHRNSTLIMRDRFATRSRPAYISWLEVVSHELFHVWNVKRLRPVALGPFDYENEALTRELWQAEGVTDYYASLLVARAGLTSEEELLQALSGEIRTLQTTPGRSLQSAEQSSFDAWIRAYRPDENSPNVAISYYVKGFVIAFLLDAEIRRVTDDRFSLDHVMRRAYERFSGEQGFTGEQFREVVNEVAGTNLTPMLDAMTRSTDELDYGRALDWFGLRFTPPTADARLASGALTQVRDGRLLVRAVYRGTPFWDAGLNFEDEILAIDGVRVLPDQFESRLNGYAAGATVEFLISRRGTIMELPVKLDPAPATTWRLEQDPSATPEQIRRRQSWLRSTAPPRGE